MLRDQHGLQMTAAGPVVVEHYDRAVCELLHYGPAMLSAPEEAFAEDSTCPMVNLLRAYLCLMSTEPRYLECGRTMIEDFRAQVPIERLALYGEIHEKQVEDESGEEHA